MFTEKLELREVRIEPASSTYPTLGAEYKCPGYSIKYSPTLTRTGKNYYESKEEIQGRSRISTAVEELAIQLSLEKAGQNPSQAEVFDDLFARNDTRWYAFQWTETGLRVPKGYKPDKYETDSEGRKYWSRIVLIGDQEIGEILVPEGNGRVVVEWDVVFGIPKVTSDKEGDMRYDNHTTHFWFNTNPSKDSKSGKYDLAVARGSLWLHVDHDRCLGVRADDGRWGAGSSDGVRPVQGSIPEIVKMLARINPREVEEALLEKIRKDFNTLPFKQFQKKYKL